jgi:hypothetical protein
MGIILLIGITYLFYLGIFAENIRINTIVFRLYNPIVIIINNKIFHQKILVIFKDID